LGTCATYGGVPCIKDFGFEHDIPEEVCPQPTYLESVKVSGIGQYIKVDYYLRGCPPDQCEIVKLMVDLLMGKKTPYQIDYPVCVECRERENKCLLMEGELCMGPATFAGCNALCPSLGITCYGCRGPIDDANVDALVKLFRHKGFSDEELKKRFVMFAGTSKKFREVSAYNE